MNTQIKETNKLFSRGGYGTPKMTEHRGIKMDDLPMKHRHDRQWVWAMFCKNLWPPRGWKIPTALTGQPLAQMIEERCSSFGKKKPRAGEGSE